MSRVVRALATCLAGVLCSVWFLAGTAEADDEISQLTTGPGSVQFDFTTRDDTGVVPTARNLTVDIDGVQIPAEVQPVGSLPSAVRTAMLVLDVSGSMSGSGLAAAVSAARSFLKDAPADVRIGLTTFATTPSLVVPPTADRTLVTSALAGVRARGDTSLYDGILTGLQALQGEGQSLLILLSDGADTTSTSTLAATVEQLRPSRTSLEVVGFNTDETATAVLRMIAASRGTTVSEAKDANGLTRAFTGAASALQRQVHVAVAIPDRFAGQQVTLTVTARTAAGLVKDTVVLALPGVPLTSSPPSRRVVPGTLAKSAVLRVGLVVFFTGLSLLVAVLLVSRAGGRDSASRSRDLLQSYTLYGRARRPRVEAGGVLGDSAIARSAVEWAGRAVQHRDREERLALKLDRAAVPLRPAEWVLVRLGAAGGGFAVWTLITSSFLLGIALGILTGLAGTAGWLNFKASRRLKGFAARLPEMLTLVAGSLSTGYSLPQALDSVVREGSQPVAGEIGRALAAARLGVPIEDALEGVARRMMSKDFEWTVMAIRIQREVGGNLSEVLLTASATLRERAQLRRQVSVLSAEGRLSAYVLVGLPVGMAIYMFTLRRSYIRPLYTEPLGIGMLSAAVFLVIVGSLWMRKLVDVEV